MRSGGKKDKFGQLGTESLTGDSPTAIHIVAHHS